MGYVRNFRRYLRWGTRVAGEVLCDVSWRAVPLGGLFRKAVWRRAVSRKVLSRKAVWRRAGFVGTLRKQILPRRGASRRVLSRPIASWRDGTLRGTLRGTMRGTLRGTLCGSTLAETLVMMLVAGIVFLTVMDGLTLFTRLQARRTEALLDAGRRTEGYYRFVSLIAAADSIRSLGTGRLELSVGGRCAELLHSDSVVVYRVGEFRDTLLDGVSALRLAEYDSRPDTVEIGFGSGFTARFAVQAPGRQYRAALEKIEEGYGYEE